MNIKNQCKDMLSQIPVAILILKMFWRLLSVSKQKSLLVKQGVERLVLICTYKNNYLCCEGPEKSSFGEYTLTPDDAPKKHREKKWLLELEYQKRELSIKDWHLLLFTSLGTRVYSTVMGLRGCSVGFMLLQFLHWTPSNQLAWVGRV